MTTQPLTDYDWMRRYPGWFDGPATKAHACWICGRPGYVVPAPPEPITVADFDALTESLVMRTGDTCPGHEWKTRQFLAEHPEFDSLISTTKGWRWG